MWKFKVKATLGEDPSQQEDSEAIFETEAEAQAYAQGLRDGVGWMEVRGNIVDPADRVVEAFES